MLEIKQFIFSPFLENTYIVWDEKTKEALIIDPGCSSGNEENELKEFIDKNGLSVKYLINTHCHIDHIFGCRFVKEYFNPVFYIPEKDKVLLENSETQSALFDLKFKKPPSPDYYITEQTKLNPPFDSLKFLYTPGHTEGEYCLFFSRELICFTGDVLFKGSIGRTDLWGGNYESLINSIESKLFSLPDEVRIYPGHGDGSTIAAEKKENPFFI